MSSEFCEEHKNCLLYPHFAKVTDKYIIYMLPMMYYQIMYIHLYIDICRKILYLSRIFVYTSNDQRMKFYYTSNTDDVIFLSIYIEQNHRNEAYPDIGRSESPILSRFICIHLNCVYIGI